MYMLTYTKTHTYTHKSNTIHKCRNHIVESTQSRIHSCNGHIDSEIETEGEKESHCGWCGSNVDKKRDRAQSWCYVFFCCCGGMHAHAVELSQEKK